jgi:hypothetical protein
VVIGNAPDAQYFHPPDVPQARTGPLRVIATSWSSNWRKGFDIYRWLDSNLDPTRLRMTFVGNSPIRFKRIEHLPATDSAQLGQLLRAHDVYITASVDDPCSNALIEAMACGLVPVARRSGGHSEIVGASGVLFDGRHDVLQALERAGTTVVGAPMAVADIGQVARQYMAFADAVLRGVRDSGGVPNPNGAQRRALLVSTRVQRYLPPVTRRLSRVLPVQGHRLLGDVGLLRQADWEPSVEAPWGLGEASAWVRGVHARLPVFLDSLRHPTNPRLYRYSLSGDLQTSPSLASSVFVAKVRQMAGLLDEDERSALGEHLLSFQKADGTIHDAWVSRRSLPYRVALAAWTRDVNNLGGQENVRAETRQAFAALDSLDLRPSRPLMEIPRSRMPIEAYVRKLNWERPWGAASHVSHLVFFMAKHGQWFNEAAPMDITALDVLDQVEKAYRQADGAWHAPGARVSPSNKVNGAMKMVTALDAAGRQTLSNPEGLIDLCLSVVNDGHACNHFNVICVLHRCRKLTAHRADEIEHYLLTRLSLYRQHYWPWSGGFSFFPNAANHRYYGARVTMGMPEPDIHGTVLMLWGIVLITEALGLCRDLPLSRPVT